ncbi:MAG: hypothetical protein ACO3PV_10755, partial [Pseudohongiellaceae bacterium]
GATAKFVAPKAGEMLSSYMRRSGMTPELMAFHGTPHRFPAEEGAPLGRFRSEKIGTGEGAQSFGYGLYFAESPGTAKTYRPVELTSEELASQIKYAEYMAANSSNPSAKEGFANAAKKLKASQGKQGSLYTVDIPDEMINKMLDWDKPLNQQPKSVQDAVAKLPFETQAVPMTGGDIVDAANAFAASEVLGRNPAGGSELLRQAGIPGIRYLDQGSRAGGEGTRNIVVFPGGEDQVKIIKVE